MKSRKKSLPLATDILSRYVIGADANTEAIRDDLTKVDAFAALLIEETATGAPDAECCFFGNVDHVVKKVMKLSLPQHAEAHAAIVEYFRKPGRDCATPEDAAEDILNVITYEHGRVGFLLGFAAALRLQSAVAGGSR
jgi:hypothetical protein